MTKKLIVTLVLLLQFSVFSGCAAETSANGSKDIKKNQRLACIEVYSANDRTLLTTIQDKESLAAFDENTSFTGEWDETYDADNDMDQQAKIQKKLENYESQYLFISYQTPAAIHNDGTLEKVLEITTFKDTNIVKVQISPDTVKNLSIPSEYLTFYLEASDEEMAYLHSLV